MSRLHRLFREEGGFALVIALAVMLALGITSTAVIEYTSSNSRSTNVNDAQQSASHLAEAGLQAAYSTLNYSGNNATNSALLGSSGSPVCVPVLVTSCTLGAQGTAAYYGSYNASAVPYPLWTITSVGYARNPTGAGIMKKTIVATANVTTNINQPANVAVWNYLYSSSPAGSGCEIDLTGTQVIVDIPVYVTGDMCLSGTQASVQEVAGGQPVDLVVQGKLVFGGNQSKVGTSAQSPITSGVVGGGCTTTINGTGHACTSADRYYVGSTGSLQQLTPPTPDLSWYNNADPGPKHACKSGTSPAGLASSVFDTDLTQGNSAATFDLTPSYSYDCQSTSGVSTGEIYWNNTTKVLTVSGVIFFDGSITVSQSLTYTHPPGVHGASIYAKTFTLSGTQTKICAVASCDFSSWDPNATMLMIVALGSGTAISIDGTQGKFQGALFANPTSTIALSGTLVDLEGPVVGGKFTWGTQTEIHPLPTITSLPPGAPLVVNAHATPGRLTYLNG